MRQRHGIDSMFSTSPDELISVVVLQTCLPHSNSKVDRSRNRYKLSSTFTVKESMPSNMPMRPNLFYKRATTSILYLKIWSCKFEIICRRNTALLWFDQMKLGSLVVQIAGHKRIIGYKAQSSGSISNQDSCENMRSRK